MVMGIPIVDFLTSQKSAEGSAYEALGELIPSFADSPRGCKETADHRFSRRCVLFIEEEAV